VVRDVFYLADSTLYGWHGDTRVVPVNSPLDPLRWADHIRWYGIDFLKRIADAPRPE
jgi:hypothetical protein